MGVVADLISLEEVNAVARSMLSFSSDIGREQDLLDLASQPDQEGLWSRPGPTRATSVVACVPAYVSSTGDGVALGGAHLDQVRVGSCQLCCFGWRFWGRTGDNCMEVGCFRYGVWDVLGTGGDEEQGLGC